jgi:hypothetical protein
MSCTVRTPVQVQSEYAQEVLLSVAYLLTAMRSMIVNAIPFTYNIKIRWADRREFSVKNSSECRKINRHTLVTRNNNTL